MNELTPQLKQGLSFVPSHVFQLVMARRDLPMESASAFVNELESALIERGIQVTRHGARVAFDVPLLPLRHGWDLFAVVSGGVIEAEQHADGLVVFCRVSLRRLLLLTVGVVAVLVPGIFELIPASIPARLGLAGFCGLWLYGVNLAVTVVRLRRLVRDVFRDASRSLRND